MDARSRWSVHRGLEQLEFEGIAEGLLREGGQEDDDAPRLGQLAIALLGPGAVEYAPIRLPGDGALIRIHDSWRVYLRRGLPIERRAFALSHELAEWWLRVREHYVGEDIENAANGIAAAIMAPRRAFARSLREHGHDFAELAADFRTTETHVALREAELTRMPRAVISPRLVRVRGPEEWIWPEEAVLRRWARRPIPGVTKVRLTDDPKRVVLDVDELETG
jgi:hypothetical protein